jgi:hypothetical protein
MQEEQQRWVKLLKELRTQRNITLLEAERIAVSRREWRRWVEHRINNDRKCRRMALSHIKNNGVASLVAFDLTHLWIVDR